jgi:hypothetical protein
VNIASVIIVVLAGVAGFFIWANYQTRKQHERFTKSDVVAALESVISTESVDHDAWDLFLSWPIKDPYLESLRKRCLDISSDHSDEPGRDLSIEGEEKVRSILKELYESV